MALFMLVVAFVVEVVSWTEEARLSRGGSWGGGGVVNSILECLGGGSGGGVTSSFSSPGSSLSFFWFLSSSLESSISLLSSIIVLLEDMLGRLIIEDLFLAGRGGGFIWLGVDGLEVEMELLEESLLKVITELIGLPAADGDGIGGGVRRPGRMVDKGRFVV